MFRRARVFLSANVQQPTARCWEKHDLSVRLQCHRVFLYAIRNCRWNDAAVRVFLSSGVTRDSDRVSSSSLITSTPKTAALKSARRAKFSVRFPPESADTMKRTRAPFRLNLEANHKMRHQNNSHFCPRSVFFSFLPPSLFSTSLLVHLPVAA